MSALSLARWAARSYGGYDLESVHRVVTAVAEAAQAGAETYARWATEEYGGVDQDKAAENRLACTGFLAAEALANWVDPRQTLSGVRLPRPLGVVAAVVPAASAAAVTGSAILSALTTRNALILTGGGRSARTAAEALAQVAVDAGAPQGTIQVVDDARELAGLLSLTAEPAGAVPVFVSSSADIGRAASRLVTSLAFDHGRLSGAESVVVADRSVAAELVSALAGAGGHVLPVGQAERVAAVLGSLDRPVAAAELAERASIPVPDGTRALLAPIDAVLPEEPFARRWNAPVAGLAQVPDTGAGIRASAAVTRLGPPGGVAVVHTGDPAVALRFASATRANRVLVNDGGSLAGTPLSHRPGALVTWTSVTGFTDEQLAAVAASGPWGSAPSGAVPAYPDASNAS